MRMKYSLLAGLSILIAGCTFNAWNKDFVTPSAKLSAPAFHLVSLGMNKADVVAALGQPDQVIGAKRVEGELIEVWEYFRIAAMVGPDQIAERYQVVFTNGQLSSYDSSGDFKQQINLR